MFRHRSLFVSISCILLFTQALSAQPPKNLSLLSTLSFPGTLAGCWHYEDGQGHAYALIGTDAGVAIVDVTDPVNPSILFQPPGVQSLWHEVKVEGDYAYAVSEGVDPNNTNNGLQIIDLRYLPDSIHYKFYTGDGAIQNMLTKAHTVTTAGHYVYINGHNISSLGNGVLICDISDPWNPQYVGAVTLNYCHDSYVRGDTIWTSDIQAGQFSVYNISNRANPVLLATQQTPGQFNHNTWLSDDGNTIFTTDERSGEPLASYDVSDLSNISFLDDYFTTNMPANEVHNVRVFNDFLLCPSYGSELTIVDALRPSNLIEVGNFTTGSSLCWDADPYFSSGIVVATDMSSGTFYVFEPTYKRACYLEGNVKDSITGLIINGAEVSIVGTTVIQNSNSSGEYKTGYPDSGTYTVTCTKTGYNTKTITGVNLANGILTTLNFEMVPVGAGVGAEKPKELLKLSPNPCTDKLNIHFEAESISMIRLLNSSGQIIREVSKSGQQSGNLELMVDQLPAGLYFIEAITTSGTYKQKFQKL